MARKKTLLERDTNITPEQLKTLVKVMKDPFLFSTFCYVINPVLGMVKFSLYPFQRAVLYQFMKNRFNIILKFRQAGITELISMYCLWLAMYHPNKKINIISIKDTVAKKVLKKIKFMYKNLPSYLQEPIINGRTGEFGSVSTIEFANGSVIESIPTSDQAGRSESLSLLVIDEAAIVRWASTIWASAFPTLSCISGSYKILLTTNPHRKNPEGSKKGLQAFLKPIGELAPSEVGIRDLRKEGLYTLTHTGAWKQILDAVYKGKLLTWEVEDCRGKKLDCTPKHRLLTPQGWKTVSDIIRYDLKVVQIDTKYGSINNTAPLVKPPKKVIFKPLFTFGKFDYQITNFGEIYRVNSDGERTKVKLRVHRGYNTLTLFSKSQGGIKNWKVSRLVYKTFVGHIPDGYVVDHINNNPLQDWVTNLRCVTNSENIKKSYETNLAYVTSLSGYPIELHSRVLQAIDLNPGKSDQEIRDLLYKQGLSLSRKSIGNIRRKSKIYLSKLIVNREYITDIYDIHVDGDHSYILPTCNFINHNTGGSAIVNSCITGDTSIIGQGGPFRVDSICPKTFGKMDISHLGLKVLSHTGKWQRVLGSVNKGILKTWEVHNEWGKVIKCTPEHKLYTLEGWLPVSEIIKRDIPAIFYHTSLNSLEQNPVTVKPVGFKYNLLEVAYIKHRYQKLGCYPRVLEQISWEVYDKFRIKRDRAYIQNIVSGKRGGSIYLSKLKVVRKYYDTIYDICVENDESYLINEDYVSHNTPYGVGNFFHGAWVDAIAGGNPLNPIRLYWQMHPDRDQKWYEEMSTALGPKRTAQEIDGDFLSSGNTVFDLVDIKAIEECLSDYPIINTRLKGQYKEFNEPDPNKEYFIGGDCATGRGTDYSAFTCMDRDGEESAVYKGRIPLNKYARLLGDIGEKYNFAKLAPETNDVGMAVTTILQDEGYPNLYFYTKLLRKKRHSRPEEEKFPGWLTTAKNRSVIVENLEKDIRENNVVIKDPFFVQEAYTFIYDGAGRPIARGKHRMSTSSMDIDLEGETYSDDSIFGKAITNHIRCHSASSTVVIPQ
jgi:hypothetical protein|nr:MAG TPA: large terminase protein [Caudoviricetes sp.]DAI91871.1 MAG TPA: large terminase protein [Caudoviricetes sp.]